MDEVVLNFNQSSVWMLNLVLAIIMFGIALNIDLNNFKTVLKNPKSLIIGLLSQFLVLPILTFILILIFKPQPSLALGMLMVASCPGGNISNFFSSYSLANVELSVTMTTISSIAAIVMTPFNFAFYGGLYTPTAGILQQIELNILDIAFTIGVIIIVPIVLAKIAEHHYPKLTEKYFKIFQYFSICLFAFIVIGALVNNGKYFMEYVSQVFLLVLMHNGVAFLSAFILATIFFVTVKDRKSITIETGIQNSGLGLLLIFSFFNGLGGMAVIAAWWGIWHIISGFALSYYWRSKINC